MSPMPTTPRPWPDWQEVRPSPGVLIDVCDWATIDGYSLVVSHLRPVSCWAWAIGRGQTDLASGSAATAAEARVACVNALMQIQESAAALTEIPDTDPGDPA